MDIARAVLAGFNFAFACISIIEGKPIWTLINLFVGMILLLSITY